MEEVLNSALRILLVSGISETEVASAFEQAAAQLRQGEVQPDDNLDSNNTDISHAHKGLWSLVDHFDDLEEVRSLNRLAKRLEVVGNRDDASSRNQTFKLVKEAISLRRSAIAWLREKATVIGVQVEHSRDKWIEEASDEELDREHEILFLDDVHWASEFSWYAVSDIARSLAFEGNRDDLAMLRVFALDDETALEDHIREDIERAYGLAGEHDAFRSHVLGQSGKGELTQAEFLQDFVARNEFSDVYVLEKWLDGMAEVGEIERYKRSNRWRVLVQ
jgi:hypothetical protein